MTAKFAKKNKTVARTIQIRGKQTLHDLHAAIFDAFDRKEDHLYEFQVGGKGPMDERARKFGTPVPVGTHDSTLWVGTYGYARVSVYAARGYDGVLNRQEGARCLSLPLRRPHEHARKLITGLS